VSVGSSVALAARHARGQLEETLGTDVSSWSWRPRLSYWLDTLVVLGEGPEW
jgi:hypothetical protein